MVALTYVGILPSRIDHKNHEGNFIGKAYSYQEIKGEVTDDKKNETSGRSQKGSLSALMTGSSSLDASEIVTVEVMEYDSINMDELYVPEDIVPKETMDLYIRHSLLAFGQALFTFSILTEDERQTMKAIIGRRSGLGETDLEVVRHWMAERSHMRDVIAKYRVDQIALQRLKDEKATM
uniref:Uncharacterized protein n=1 Tax=Populus trichocarpa TaxID=3694 RepID=A0A2K1XYG0_POPTR